MPAEGVTIGLPERPSSPAQVVPRSAPLVSWPAIRKRVISKEDPGVETLVQRCVSQLQCTTPWMEHLREALRAAKASFQQHHGRPAASVDALLGHWREEKGNKRCFEVLMSPDGGAGALRQHMEDWATDAEQVLRKHARVGLLVDTQNTGQPHAAGEQPMTRA